MVKHLTHFEDLYVLYGSDLFRQIGPQMNEGSFDASVKWDGSPSIIVGNNGQDFVATKSFYNKISPKIYYDSEDMGDIDDGLKIKLKKALDSVRGQIELNHIYQGDLMFHENDGDHELVAQPNVVRYHFQNVNQNHQVGIAWHTTLTGDGLFSSSKVYSINSELPKSSLTNYCDLLKVAPNFIHDDIIMQYHNYCIIRHTPITYDKSLIKEFIEFKKSQHIRKLKTQKGRDKAASYWNTIYDEICCMDLETHEYNIRVILEWKQMLMEEMHSLAKSKFHHTTAFINETESHEGFVLKSRDYHFKLVNRSLFSIANFNAHSS